MTFSTKSSEGTDVTQTFMKQQQHASAEQKTCKHNAKLFGTNNHVTLKVARQWKTKGKVTVDDDEDIGVLHEIYFLQW